jgi:hypothetical protein
MADVGAILARVSSLPVPVIVALNGQPWAGNRGGASLRLVYRRDECYFSLRQGLAAIMTAWGGALRLLAPRGSRVRCITRLLLNASVRTGVADGAGTT